MKRFLLLIAGLAGALALLAAAALAERPRVHAASITEVGRLSRDPAPSCPGSSCRVVTRTTGYGRTSGTVVQPDRIPRDGRIVALTLRLGNPTRAQRNFFNKTYGGDSQVQLTVLRTSRRPQLSATAIGQSGITHAERYFGKTAQFPLHNSLEVRRGDIVAVSVPTWAPILAVRLSKSNQWRASRSPGRAGGGCSDFARQTAQTRLGAKAQYLCAYSTARLTYSATLISTP